MTKIDQDTFGGRRSVPFITAVAAAVGISAVAYSGRIPSAVAAHGIDKVLHATMGFVLTLLLARALPSRRLRSLRSLRALPSRRLRSLRSLRALPSRRLRSLRSLRALPGQARWAGAWVMLPLAADEYMQRFSSSRTSDWGDLLADIVGVTLAIVVAQYLGKASRATTAAGLTAQPVVSGEGR